MALSPDGSRLATAGAGGAIVWNLAVLKSAPIALKGQGSYGVAFSSDGTRLAISDSEHHVRVCDLRCERPPISPPGERRGVDVQSVAFVAGDRMVVSVGSDPNLNLRFWDAATGNSLGMLPGHSDKVWGASVSPDGTTLATASSDGTAKLWNPRPPDHEFAVLHASDTDSSGQMAFTPDGQLLLVVHDVGRVGPDSTGALDYHDSNLEVSGFDTRSGTEQFHRHIRKIGKRTTGGVLLSNGGAIAVLLPFPDASHSFTTLQVSTGEQLAVIDHIVSHSLPPPLGQFVAVQRPDRPIELVDAATGQTRCVLGGTEPVDLRAVSPNCDVLAVRLKKRADQLVIWDVPAKRARSTHRAIRAVWGGMTFSPDGRILAAGDGTAIQLFDVLTLKPIGSLAGHTEDVGCLAISPDGRTLVSSDVSTLKIWDIAARAELLSLSSPIRGVRQILFAPDGRSLAFYAAETGAHLLRTTMPDDLATEDLSRRREGRQPLPPGTAFPLEQLTPPVAEPRLIGDVKAAGGKEEMPFSGSKP
jgi:WD40 repeat protein